MKKINSILCFLNGLLLTIKHIPWVTGHDYIELGRKAGDPRYMKTLECKRCGHEKVGWSRHERRIELGLNNIKCPQCGYPFPPDPPPLVVIMEDGRELRKDGWGVQRDRKGHPAHPWYSIGNFMIMLIAIAFLVFISTIAFMLINKRFP